MRDGLNAMGDFVAAIAMLVGALWLAGGVVALVLAAARWREARQMQRVAVAHHAAARNVAAGGYVPQWGSNVHVIRCTCSVMSGGVVVHNPGCTMRGA